MAADPNALFRTQRSKLIDLYKKAGQQFDASTFPYTSTRPLVFDIVEAFPAAPNQNMAHAVARAGQVLSFFSYGTGASIQDGFGGSFNATPSDTNQENANQTNGGSDYIIEGVSVTARSHRIQWPAETASGAGVTDPDVIAAYEGNQPTNSQPLPVPIGDPAALMSPPQLDSPLNLQNLLMAKALPLLALTFQFDKKRIEVIGNLDQIPEGGASPLLFASGDPRTDNRYRIPEGYLWRAAGQPDSNFNGVVTLSQPLVIPIQLGPLFGATDPPQGGFKIPRKMALDIKMRVHGLQVAMPSSN